MVQTDIPNGQGKIIFKCIFKKLQSIFLINYLIAIGQKVGWLVGSQVTMQPKPHSNPTYLQFKLL
jgi:hypothetical protein